MAKRKKKKNKSPSKFYVLGSLVLVVILVIGIMMKGTDDLHNATLAYVLKKQQITATLGEIETIEITKRPTLTQNGEAQNIEVAVHGRNKTGTLTLKAKNIDGNWVFGTGHLKTDSRQVTLNHLLVADVIYRAASRSSAPLTEPVFLDGENIYFDVTLTGDFPKTQKAHVVESLEILNDKGEIVAEQNPVTTFFNNVDETAVPQIQFQNHLSNLAPGTYSIVLRFDDKNHGVQETHQIPLTIQSSGKNLYVKNVRYFKDASHQTPQRAEFEANQNIHLTLELEGFKPNQNQVAGTVDLQITNAAGEIIAQKPKFAAFNDELKSGNHFVVSGHLKLKQPDIYFLTFRVRDHFSKREVTHSEKLLVKLGAE